MEKMRVDVDFGFTGDGDEDWGCACLYLSDDEIEKFGLMPTNYKGGEYDWIFLPERDYEAKEGEHLIAAYGGMLSEICMVKSVANSSDSCGAYYSLPGFENSRIDGDIDYLPNELKEQLFNAIENYCGTYYKEDFNEPFFDAREKRWVEAEK